MRVKVNAITSHAMVGVVSVPRQINGPWDGHIWCAFELNHLILTYPYYLYFPYSRFWLAHVVRHLVVTSPVLNTPTRPLGHCNVFSFWLFDKWLVSPAWCFIPLTLLKPPFTPRRYSPDLWFTFSIGFGWLRGDSINWWNQRVTDASAMNAASQSPILLGACLYFV